VRERVRKQIDISAQQQKRENEITKRELRIFSKIERKKNSSLLGYYYCGEENEKKTKRGTQKERREGVLLTSNARTRSPPRASIICV
jgi:hypothetical protein